MSKLQKAEKKFTMILFGASGSLAKLKLFPALYELAEHKRLPRDFHIVGYARTPMDEETFRKHFEKAVRAKVKEPDESVLKRVLKRIHYFSGQYDDPADYRKLLRYLKSIEKDTSRVRMAYLSVPPSAYDGVFASLCEVNLNTRRWPLRIVIEKPFGHDYRSAKKLKKKLSCFKEEQVFLMDHYLGKEAVQNLFSLRYANSILTTLMNKENVAQIQISALESADIEGRAGYFDQSGILRDMVQSHLFQTLAYLTLSPPHMKRAESIHREKARILKSIRIDSSSDSLVRGQYQSYKREKGVPDDSETETYVALKMQLKHPLWKGVPIYLRAGKALKRKWTGVVVEFKPQRPQLDLGHIEPNRLVIELQPNESIRFELLTKLGDQLFGFHSLPTGRPIYCSGDCLSEYARLLLDILEGDHGRFLHFDEIFASWKVIDPLAKCCLKMQKKGELTPYKKGSLGPKDELTDWFNPF